MKMNKPFKRKDSLATMDIYQRLKKKAFAINTRHLPPLLPNGKQTTFPAYNGSYYTFRHEKRNGRND